MTSIREHFEGLRSNIDKVIETLLALHPNEASQVQREVSSLCEKLLLTWTASKLPSELSQEPRPHIQSEQSQDRLSESVVLPDSSRATLRQELQRKNDVDVILDHGEQSLNITEDPDQTRDRRPSNDHLPPKLPFASDKHLTAALASNQLHKLPSDVVQPLALFSMLQDQLGPEHRSWTPLLVRLFYAIGSPESFLQLRDACRFIRHTPFKARPVSIGSSELAETVQALDLLEDTDCVASILRRYHLSRLVAYRNTRFQLYQAKFPDVKVTKFKHGHVRVKQAKPNEGQKTAASGALKDLLAEAYPQLHDTGGKPLSKSSGPHQRAHKSLKRRLGNGRNWLVLTESLSPGVLSLVPTGGDFTIHNHQIEMIPAAAFQAFLDVLSSQRGGFLRMASTMLSKGIFEILMGKELERLWYPLENFTEESCESEGFDSFAFVTGCTTKAGQNPRKSNPRFLGGEGTVDE